MMLGKNMHLEKMQTSCIPGRKTNLKIDMVQYSMDGSDMDTSLWIVLYYDPEHELYYL